MVKRIFILFLVAAITVLCMNGCKKKSDEEPVEVKTEAEYKAEAEKQINTENMEAELDKLEKEIEQEAATE